MTLSDCVGRLYKRFFGFPGPVGKLALLNLGAVALSIFIVQQLNVEMVQRALLVLIFELTFPLASISFFERSHISVESISQMVVLAVVNAYLWSAMVLLVRQWISEYRFERRERRNSELRQ